MKPRQHLLDIHQELIVDLFAGGGGMSKGIYMALGRHPDIAINHNDDALSMHRINHPQTRHFVADVFEVCPHTVCHGRPVGHLHASPDCTHHSQAAGGQPRNEKRRALSWVVTRWVGQVKPRVITMENVKQILQWGPLVASRCKVTGRVITLDKVQDPVSGKMVNRVADKGEVVPRDKQYLVPDKKRAGKTWKRFVQLLEGMGYEVQWKNLIAADFGAGTTRDRLFLIARNDGVPITFPEPTHFKNPKRGQKRWSAAHEHIDFGIESQSIFERKKPLADATMRRIAKGMHKFVINNPNPFIVQVTQSSSNGVHDITAPLNTITTAKGGEFAVATPILVQSGHGEGCGDTKRWGMGAKSIDDTLGTIVASGGGQSLATAILVQSGYGEREGQEPRVLDIDKPLGTLVGTQKHALATAFLAQMKFDAIGREITDPVPTITSGGNSARDAGAAHSLGLVAGSLVKLRGDNIGQSPIDPLATISAGGTHHGFVSAHLTAMAENVIGHDLEDPLPTVLAGATRFGLCEYELAEQQENIEKALRVSAFLMSYYGTENVSAANDPLPTITTKDRLALVTVIYQGTPHLIVDIRLRMLKPKELYSAQGFDKDYIFTTGHDGRQFSVAEQVRMVGNSVSPYPAAALVACCHAGDEMRLVA